MDEEMKADIWEILVMQKEHYTEWKTFPYSPKSARNQLSDSENLI